LLCKWRFVGVQRVKEQRVFKYREEVPEDG